MVARSPALHTGGMADVARATVFVTGADGFLGRELVNVLVARGHQVFALTGSLETAQSVWWCDSRREGLERGVRRKYTD